MLSRGELEYQAPGQLSKKITTPETVTYKIRKDIMTVQRQGKVMQINLDTQPEIALGISALRNLLEGNRHGLEEDFYLKYHADKNAQGWELVLVPFDDALHEKVDRVVMQGKANRLDTVKMEYANGDTLLTRITNEE